MWEEFLGKEKKKKLGLLIKVIWSVLILSPCCTLHTSAHVDAAGSYLSHIKGREGPIKSSYYQLCESFKWPH